MVVALETLEYLKKGGRISGAQAAIGTLLSVKPIIFVKHGAVETADRVRTRSKARERLLELITARPVERLSVLHTLAPDVEAFRDEVLAADPRPRPRAGHDRARRAPRSVRTSGPGCVGAVGDVPAQLTGHRTLRLGCDNLAYRYHRAGADRRSGAILRAADESRVHDPADPPEPC